MGRKKSENSIFSSVAVFSGVATPVWVGHRLRNRLSNEIEAEQSASLSGYAVKAVSYLKFLAESAKSESVRLGAIKDNLDRAGFKPVDKQEINQVSEFTGWSDVELNPKYKRLMQAEMEKHKGGQQMMGMFEHENYLEEDYEDN